MFGKLGDMMGKLQEMKQKAEEVKAKLVNTTIDVEGAGGDIKIVVRGDRKIVELKIAAALQHGNAQELEKQLIESLNEALEKVDHLNDEEMKKAAGGLIPGL